MLLKIPFHRQAKGAPRKLKFVTSATRSSLTAKCRWELRKHFNIGMRETICNSLPVSFPCTIARRQLDGRAEATDSAILRACEAGLMNWSEQIVLVTGGTGS